MLNIRNCVDLPTLAKEKKHIYAILNGLPSDYEMFITSINLRVESYTVTDLEALLLTHEVMLEKKNYEFDHQSNQIMANYEKSGGNYTHSGHQYSNNPQQQQRQGFNNNNYNPRGAFNNR